MAGDGPQTRLRWWPSPGVSRRRHVEASGRGDTLTYVITDPCIGTIDKSCVEVCPVDCIHFEEGVDRKLYIDPDECIDCGACEPVCPVTAIFADDDVPDDMKEYTEIDAVWFKDKDAARARVNELNPV